MKTVCVIVIPYFYYQSPQKHFQNIFKNSALLPENRNTRTVDKQDFGLVILSYPLKLSLKSRVVIRKFKSNYFSKTNIFFISNTFFQLSLSVALLFHELNLQCCLNVAHYSLCLRLGLLTFYLCDLFFHSHFHFHYN